MERPDPAGPQPRSAIAPPARPESCPIICLFPAARHGSRLRCDGLLQSPELPRDSARGRRPRAEHLSQLNHLPDVIAAVRCNRLEHLYPTFSAAL